ncbi:mechanosensitive ion channel family protein [Chloroflexota bacterium]
MWLWFSDISVWVLILGGILLSVLLIFRDGLKAVASACAAKAQKDRADKISNIVFWVVESLLFLIVLLAFLAVILSNEGAKATLSVMVVERWLLEHGTQTTMIIVVSVILWVSLQRFLPGFMSRALVKTKGENKEGLLRRRNTLNSIMMGVGKAVIIIITTIVILQELGVSIGPILAGFGVAGIAVGFGAQYLIRDLIAGVFIIMENQFRVGDVARVADTTGLVEDITLRKTVLRDLDGIVHHVPNGEIRVASNYSRHFARVNLDISVSYGTDLDYAIGVINRVCRETAEDEAWASLFKTVPHVLRVNKLGDSGIDIKIIGDVKPLEQWRIMGELRLRIKRVFDAEGIEIPWPHTKLFFGNTPEGKEIK